MSLKHCARAILLLVLLLAGAGCGTSGDGTEPAAATAAPAAATVEAAQTQPVADAERTAIAAIAATVEPAGTSVPEPTPRPPTATKDVPPPAATITAAPTATAFPLEAGWWDNAVCYEIFVRSFYDSDGDGIGDLTGLTQKLDYLNDGNDATNTDLGVNCLWLMPIAESPSYHGYDVTDYRKIEPDYGTNEDFKAFMDEAHKRGINVIVDLVLNHTSSEHPWFKEASSDPQSKYRDWYLWSNDDPAYKGPWGQKVWHPAGDDYFYGIFWEGMPDLNYRNPEVTQEALQITRFWVEEMGVDGFRLDAIKHLIENGKVQENTPETHAWLREYRAFLQGLDRPVYTVGEIFDAPTTLLNTYLPDQLDAYFDFGTANAILKSANTGLAATYLNAVNTASTRLPYQRFAPFLTNHDQNRVMNVLDGDFNKARVAAIALLSTTGLPFIYYGEEIGMQGQKPDEHIRTPMQWAGDEGGGFTSGRPWEAFQKDYQEVNVEAQDDDPASLLNLYRRLIQLHRAHPALGHGDFLPLKASDGSVAAFLRRAEDETVLVVLNFGKSDKQGVTLSGEATELAAGTYQLTPLLGDTAGAPLVIGAEDAITDFVPLPALAAQSGYIFRLEQ